MTIWLRAASAADTVELSVKFIGAKVTAVGMAPDEDVTVDATLLEGGGVEEDDEEDAAMPSASTSVLSDIAPNAAVSATGTR
jgi:hypothetical protein